MIQNQQNNQTQQFEERKIYFEVVSPKQFLSDWTTFGQSISKTLETTLSYVQSPQMFKDAMEFFKNLENHKNANEFEAYLVETSQKIVFARVRDGLFGSEYL